LNSNPHAKYLFEGAKTLVDGRVGGPDFGGGPWIGYLFEDMDVTIDMEGSESYSKVSLTALAQKAPWVFLPMSMTVLTSDDNENFTQVGHIDIEPQAKGEPDGIFKFDVEFEPTAARYLRVQAATLDPVSPWHNGGGGKGFLFAGEIEVE
jgi:hexosaminidase